MSKDRKPTTLPLGTVSWGTMQPRDVMPAIIGALGDIRLSAKDRREVDQVARTIAGLDDDAEYWHSEDADWDSELLFGIADNHTPPYCYFGASEGDGSDYGVWVAWDAIDDDRRYNELPDTDKVPVAYTGYSIDVNDHGNATLYRHWYGRRAIVWEVV